jgi:hypothetical protein
MRKLLAYCLLISPVCFAQALLGPARQSGNPVRLVSTTHSTSDALKQATLENRSGKSIASYRIGWATVVAGKTTMDEGGWVKIADGLQPGATTEVPALGISIDQNAHLMMFFVSKVVRIQQVDATPSEVRV